MTITKKHLTPLAHTVALCEVLMHNKDINKQDALNLIANNIKNFAVEHSNNFSHSKWYDGVRNEKESIEGVIFARTQNIKLVNK